MTLRPWTAFLQRRQNNTIFHEKTTRQALEKIFGDYAEQKAEFRTAGGKTHTFRVQWDETDYNYLHRRMEEEGWFYWYEHSRNSHTLIIHDDSRLAPDIDDGPIVRFHNDSTVLEHCWGGPWLGRAGRFSSSAIPPGNSLCIPFCG